ncbi:MAG TPA: hypothetical protein VMU92_04390 [Acidobacteriaceae bacterium]|nr:hypothetical protein [Acidobacteriaceae bacterium]
MPIPHTCPHTLRGVLPSSSAAARRSLLPRLLAALLVALALLAVRASAQPSQPQRLSSAMVPRIGVLIPNGPPDYRILMDAFTPQATEHLGPFTFRLGLIGRVPVVLVLPPADGPVLRSLAAQSMFEHYNIKAVLYAGTSGAHLGPGQMRIGDIVLGAKNVDFGNFFLSRTGEVLGGEFDTKAHHRPFHDLYLDPQLLPWLACSATRVATHTHFDSWVNPRFPRSSPRIFYFGVQGTSTMWLANPAFIRKVHRAFGELDEDGDWYSNLAATLYHVPFIEVSVISDSILEFPKTKRGQPTPPSPGQSSNLIAQRISNRIAVDLIRRFGNRILAGRFTTPQQSPFPAAYFQNPTHPQSLLAGLDCH